MKYNLINIDGNAFSIICYVTTAMKKEGRNKKEIDKYREVATSADYKNLIAVSINMLDTLNGEP